MTKFCKDCAHRVDDDVNPAVRFSRCAKALVAEATLYHLVDGSDPPRPKLLYCAIARRDGHECGPEGALWQPAVHTSGPKAGMTVVA